MNNNDSAKSVENDREIKEESKHKIQGKHALQYDSIFKGKKKEYDEDDVYNDFEEYDPDYLVPKQDSFNFEVGSSYFEENMKSDESHRLRQLREDIYEIIVTKTQINIKSSRRKPGRVDFNRYLSILNDNLDTNKYTYSEIFTEFSFYFSDNLVNMFKLLNEKWGGKISKELENKSDMNLDDLDFM